MRSFSQSMTLETEKSLCLWKAHKIKEAPIGISRLQMFMFSKTGHYDFQIRPPRVETGQYQQRELA